MPLLVSVDKKLHSVLYISIQLCEINGYHMGTTKADPGFLRGGGADLTERYWNNQRQKSPQQ